MRKTLNHRPWILALGRKTRCQRARAVASLVLGFLFAAACPAADMASPLPRGNDNPALTRFGRSVVFYVGFDGHALAEITSGSPVPQGNAPWAAVKQPRTLFEKGVYGQGLVSQDYRLVYECTGSVLRASGSLALWLKADKLNHVGTYFWPVMLHAKQGGYSVMFGRMGDPRNKEAEGSREASLGIHIDDVSVSPATAEQNGQCRSGRCLCGPSLLVGYGDDLDRHFS